LTEIKESGAVYLGVMNEADDAIEIWEKLKEDLEDGKNVFAPSDKSNKKRKRSAGPKDSRYVLSQPLTSLHEYLAICDNLGD
jgi:hypothetical protein